MVQVQEVLRDLRAMVGAGAELLGGRDGVTSQLGAAALRLLQHLRLLCVHPALVLNGRTPQTAFAKDKLMGEVEVSGKLLALQSLLFSCGVITEYEEGEEEKQEGQEAELEVQEEDEEEEEMEVQEEEMEGEEQEQDAEGVKEGGGQGAEEAKEVAEEGLHRCLIFAQHRDTLDAIERAVLRRAR